MDIRISQQFGQIGINYTQPQMNIISKPADMRISQMPATVDIFTDYPQVNIDMSGVREDIGYKGILSFAREHANEGQANVLGGIERAAGEGDALARSVGKGREIFGQIAWNNWFDNVEINVDVVPHNPPRIWFTGGTSFNVKHGKVKVDAQPNFPEIEGIAGKVEIYLAQKPEIKMETVGRYIDLVI